MKHSLKIFKSSYVQVSALFQLNTKSIHTSLVCVVGPWSSSSIFWIFTSKQLILRGAASGLQTNWLVRICLLVQLHTLMQQEQQPPYHSVMNGGRLPPPVDWASGGEVISSTFLLILGEYATWPTVLHVNVIFDVWTLEIWYPQLGGDYLLNYHV